MNNSHTKYDPYPPVKIKNRKWPNKIIKKAPMWCSVDLRDGNQALLNQWIQSEKCECLNN